MYPFWKRLGNVCTDFCAAAMNTFPICSLKNVYTLNAHWIDDGADFSLGSPVVRRSHGFIVTTVVGAINFLYIYSGENKKDKWVGGSKLYTYTKISRLEQKVSLCNIRSFVQLYNIFWIVIFCFVVFFFPHLTTQWRNTFRIIVFDARFFYFVSYIYIGSIHIADFRFFLRAYDIYLFFFVVCYLLFFRYIVKKKQKKNYTISGMFSSAMEPVCGAEKCKLIWIRSRLYPVRLGERERENSRMTERDNRPCPSLAQVYFFFVFFSLCVWRSVISRLWSCILYYENKK